MKAGHDSPVTLFEKFFTSELVAHICEQSTLYAAMKDKAFSNSVGSSQSSFLTQQYLWTVQISKLTESYVTFFFSAFLFF